MEIGKAVPWIVAAGLAAAGVYVLVDHVARADERYFWEQMER